MQRTKWRYLLPAMVLACGSAEAGTELPPPLKSGAGAEVPAAVPSTTAETSGRDTSLGRLEDIQARTLLYEAQLAQAKALNELQKNGYDAVLGAPFNPQPVAQSKMKKEGEPRPSQESKSLPQIVEISGGQSLWATLQLEGGNQVRVQSGSRIPGTVWTVAKITFGEVTVRSADGSLVSLAFAG